MSAALERLTPRQREVVQLVVYELASNDVVAGRLDISIKTVQTHRSQINRNLGVHSTPELMALVYRDHGGPVAEAPLASGYSPRRDTGVRSNRNFYFDDRIAAELDVEAKRLARSKSWLMQRAWKIARERIQALPGVEAR